ncbi:AAA family ATPase [Actinoplanes sp. LDG1-06]|uniref:AAA family ATPase n=1 Tax=Paractinoplanes ovalisporus TaxID=2810368 RepID=A0ABS2A2B2_9ACTN|nr:ATP-binding protein [Actinoplanes ovalisporus]MBM2613991.1 AAA family ATPase [Actinoplanes ovalisporus]
MSQALRRLDRLLGPALDAARRRSGPEPGSFRGPDAENRDTSGPDAENKATSGPDAENKDTSGPDAENKDASRPDHQDKNPRGPGDQDNRTNEEDEAPTWPEIARDEPGWRWLRDTYALTDRECDVVLLALAPELDLRYERIYAYLQDDPVHRRPTVDLALTVVAPAGRQQARALFGTAAPLSVHSIVTLSPGPDRANPPLLAHAVMVDPQIADVLLGQVGLDRRLAATCTLSLPPAAPADEDLVRMCRSGRPLRIRFTVSDDDGGQETAEAVAGALGVPLLTAGGGEPEKLLLREAALHGALLYTDRQLIVGSERHTEITVEIRPPAEAVRRRIWQEALKDEGHDPDENDLDDLADRFRLRAGQIRDAARAATASGRPPGRETWFAAARARGGHQLAALAHRISPVHGWDDLILPVEAGDQLRDICDRVVHRRHVLEDWGFGRRMSQGRGVSALFAGPPGTGKTMAAEVVARDLGLDLYRIDLAAVVSKYIGETEKNLERIFTAAAGADAILFFDEADALFGKRSDVRDAHDRYANIEVAYLLQRIERLDGLAILATNLRTHLDDAFVRRLHFVVDFPQPEKAERRRIWQVCFPPETPRDPALDLDRLAARFRLSGAEIHNIVLAAAYAAAGAGERISETQVLAATRRELSKAGRVFPEAEAD